MERDGSGFVESYKFLSRWLTPVPKPIKDEITTIFPGSPDSPGGSDHKSFIAVGAPGFRLRSLDWSYSSYTWHTNLDTYDKIVFEDVRNNVILTAILAYMASEDPEFFDRTKREMPIDPATGKPGKWLESRQADRTGN